MKNYIVSEEELERIACKDCQLITRLFADKEPVEMVMSGVVTADRAGRKYIKIKDGTEWDLGVIENYTDIGKSIQIYIKESK